MTTFATNLKWIAIFVLAVGKWSALAQESTEVVVPVDPARVQAAVAGGLKWLADHQIKEGRDAGSWECRQYPSAVASFAGLAFLANGHMPGRGKYSNEVTRTLNYVKAGMTQDGYLGTQGNSMYVHAICSLFGLSCLGMSMDLKDDQELAEWCRKSLKVITQAQKIPKRNGEQGGWRYSPTTGESDLSVTSWQMLTLHSARQCGYPIDPVCFQEGLRYIDSGWKEVAGGVGGFVYRPGVSKEPEAGISGSAVFIKSIIEPDADVGKTREFLRQFPPAWGGAHYNGYFYFVSFYLAQGMLQQGGSDWDSYSAALQKILLEHQEGDGHWAFPSDNRPIEGEGGVGATYATAMAVLMLSLEKQYLPMYQRQMRLY